MFTIEMEQSMDQVGGSAARPKTGKALGCVAAALLFAAAIGLPQAADAAVDRLSASPQSEFAAAGVYGMGQRTGGAAS